jgi:hypothetical protein
MLTPRGADRLARAELPVPGRGRDQERVPVRPSVDGPPRTERGPPEPACGDHRRRRPGRVVELVCVPLYAPPVHDVLMHM